MKLNVAVTFDKRLLAHWQPKAIDYTNDLIDVKLVLDCSTKNPQSKILDHFYYLQFEFSFIKQKETGQNTLIFPWQSLLALSFLTKRVGSVRRVNVCKR